MIRQLPGLFFLFAALILASHPVSAENIMKIRPVEAVPGDTILVEVEVLNENDFSGFNVDIPLPAGFTYVDGSFAMNPERLDGHSATGDVNNANVMKILAYSMSNTPFPGNEGVLFSFQVVTPEQPGTYTLVLRDAVLGGLDFTNILTGTVDGIVDLQYEQALLTIDVEGEGEVTVDGDLYTEPVSVDKGTALLLEATPAPGWQFDQWSGDTTGTDVSLQLTMDEDKAVVAGFSVIPSGDNVMGIPDVSVYGGREAEFSVTISNEDEFAGFVADIRLPDGFSYLEETASLNADRVVDHELEVSHPEDGLLRLSATSPTSDSFSGEEGAVVFFDLLAGENYGEFPVVIEDAHIINPYDIDILSDKEHGVVSVTPAPVTLTFEVVDEQEEAIEDAVVTFDGEPADAGDYVFAGLTSGTYTYRIEREGYFPEEGEVTVTDEDVELQVEMETDDTAVVDAEELTLEVFPNPARSRLTVSTAGVRINEVRLLDVTGKLVYEATPNDHLHNIDVSGLLSGIYMLQVFTLEGAETLRVQVAR